MVSKQLASRPVPLRAFVKKLTLKDALRTKGWLNLKQACMYLGISKRKLLHLVGELNLPVKHGGLYRITREDLEMLENRLRKQGHG